MSLSLPANFKNDIQGRDTALIPVVVIYKSGWDSSEIINISTNHVTLASGTAIFKPLLLNIPSLKESIDIEKRNYKISSVNLDISNYEYEGKRFSELAPDSLINVNCNIYWISPSVTDLVDATSGALRIFKGTIRRYTHDDGKVRLVVEDRSQATLHKDLPIANLGTGTDVPDKYKNKPIPMVYGHVDRSPLVIQNTTYLDTGLPSTIQLLSDNVTNSYQESNLDIGAGQIIPQSAIYFFKNDDYFNVSRFMFDDPDTPNTDESTAVNFFYDGEKVNFNFQQGNLTFHNSLGIWIRRNFNDIAFIDGRALDQGEGDTAIEALNGYDGGDESSFTSGVSNCNDGVASTYCLLKGSFVGETQVSEWGLIKFTLDAYQEFDQAVEFDANGNEVDSKISTWFVGKIAHNNSYSGQSGIYTYWGLWWDHTDGNSIEPTTAQALTAQTLQDNGDSTYIGWSICSGNYNSYDGNDNIFHLVERNSVNSLSNIMIGIPMHKYEATFQVHTKIYDAFLIQAFKTNGIADKNFYANVEGRKASDPKAPVIIKDILVSELDQLEADIDTLPTDYDWKYAFTVDKKINSKKLIEGIASASPYIPRFDNMGNFKFDVIPMDGGTSGDSDTHHIKEADVIDFSFSRTPIEDVYTKIEFKYNWDYARGEFNDSITAEMGDDIINGYSFDYYGFKMPDNGDDYDHAESTLVIDDDRGKYIRNHITAQEFAEWYLMWSCNQHLKMKIKLPLKYMNLEIGDMVDFDAILGGVKPYGIDYYEQLDGGTVNSQNVFKNFLITSTNKTLEWVEIECVMMHNLDITTVLGCTDPNACNYNETANEDNGSCEYVADCNDDCGGTAVIDSCGVCGGGFFVEDADGCFQCDPPIDLDIDECNVCGGDNSPDTGNCDCAGVPNGGLEYDICGVCNGTGYLFLDEPCVIDENDCYVCPLTGTTYGSGCDEFHGDLIQNQIACNFGCSQFACDCDGNVEDECGVCGGDGASMCWDGSYECDASDCPALDCPGDTVELWGETYDIATTTEIILYGNQSNLIGEIIPPEIGCLTNLTYLRLNQNQLTGEIPPEIGNLTNLTELRLHSNDLTGDIPVEIGDLINLTTLQLYSNKLKEEIPSEIGNLTNLEDLRLYNNQLSGEIPSGIGNLTNLTKLWLHINQLTGEIPGSICNLVTNNCDIKLQDNQLCPPYPDCIAENIGTQVTSDDDGVSVCPEPECGLMGDINDDGGHNILDIVMLASCVLAGDCSEIENGCAGDLNGDGGHNVLDIVALVNCILVGDCDFGE